MKSSLILTATTLLLSATVAAHAADWGYDDPAQQTVQPMRAVAQPLLKGSNGSSQTTKTAKSTSAAGTSGQHGRAPALIPSPRGSATQPLVKAPSAVANENNAFPQKIDENSLTRECWCQIYEMAGGNKLSDDQRSRLQALVQRQLAAGGKTAAEMKAVVSFWPKVTNYLVQHPEQQSNYSVLLRALLRFRSRNENALAASNSTDELHADESALISEVLGALRLSATGTVPFSEEAVNAYADMACFIYEQKNPGKSIDASDNRAMFAQIVAEKFRNAPSDKDRMAMAGFDLTWAKFKIAWTQADERTRSGMLQKLIHTGAGAAGGDVHDPVLEAVIHNWPSAASTAVVSTSSVSHNK